MGVSVEGFVDVIADDDLSDTRFSLRFFVSKSYEKRNNGQYKEVGMGGGLDKVLEQRLPQELAAPLLFTVARRA